MKLEEYLATVTDQIRCKKAHALVSEELRDHVMDQAKAYEAEGMFEDDALEKAVQEMGDPVETGVALDRVHRPQMAKDVLVLAAVISVVGILAQLAVYHTGMVKDGSRGYLKNYMMYTIYGYLAMLLVYRLDYSFLGKYAKQVAAGFLAVMVVLPGIGGIGVTVNGMLMYLHMGPFYISIATAMLLYVPVFAGVLYQYRGDGKIIFLKALFWAGIPVWAVMHLPGLSQSIVLGISLAGVFTVAIWKGWYKIERKKSVLFIWLSLFLLPFAALLTGFSSGVLPEYQAARLQAMLDGKVASYQVGQLREIMDNSALIGRSSVDWNTQYQGMENALGNDFLFSFLLGSWGILAAAAAVGLLLFLIMRIFRISSAQKNQLGSLIGMGCGMVYLCQILMHLAVNLGILPTTATLLPFFSTGGSGLMVSYLLLGLVLSVYRYKNILSGQASPQWAQ